MFDIAQDLHRKFFAICINTDNGDSNSFCCKHERGPKEGPNYCCGTIGSSTEPPTTNQYTTESRNESDQILRLEELLILFETEINRLAHQNLTPRQQIYNQIWLENEVEKFAVIFFFTDNAFSTYERTQRMKFLMSNNSNQPIAMNSALAALWQRVEKSLSKLNLKPTDLIQQNSKGYTNWLIGLAQKSLADWKSNGHRPVSTSPGIVVLFVLIGLIVMTCIVVFAYFGTVEYIRFRTLMNNFI